MEKEISKTYNHKEVEDKVYKTWEEAGCFNPDSRKKEEGRGKEYFSIVLPPPNVTGTLHLGHAVMLALEDVMIRYHRMRGDDTLWVPGMDHAAIATQNVVEKKLLEEQKKTRHDLGRENFLKEVAKFVEESKKIIRNQTKKMGASLDWSREAYTLDEVRCRAVQEVFVKMYNEGLIYRGHRIVNWCPRCHSTLSDDEVEYKEARGKLYYIKYRLINIKKGSDSNPGEIIVATTRPETKLGDTGIAVHPDDQRYKKYVGNEYEVDLAGHIIRVKVFSDKEVDPEFGTGAIGVTPAHSFIDYEWALKHELGMLQVIDEDGKMSCHWANCPENYVGLAVEEARKKFVQDLNKTGLLEKVEDHTNNLSICYRCKTLVEPLPSLQWFVYVNKRVTIKGNGLFQNKSLKEVATEVVEKGPLKKGPVNIIPDRFKKTYFHWVENLRDWCISRQIWFGHRIPVWYNLENKSIYEKYQDDPDGFRKYLNFSVPRHIAPGAEKPAIEGNWVQDPDTLDTWFSSGLWTFSTLLDKDFDKYKNFEEWVKNSRDYKRFHPTTVLETGYDILFFWVARMIIQTTYVLGEVPFKNVYLHGLVRDKYGDKMSKSKPETQIDPLDMIEKFGTDSLRLSMIVGNTPGNDFRLYEEKIAGYRNFVNKLWNISRYILMGVNQESGIRNQGEKPKPKTLADRWILEQLENLKYSVRTRMEHYAFSLVAEELRDFTWNEFADWYIEISKIEKNKDEVLLYVLENLLKLWHPFTPFITEQIWQSMGKDKMLIIESWPKDQGEINLTKVNTDFQTIMEVITGIRSRKNENKIPPAKKLDVIISAGKEKRLIEKNKEVIKRLARLQSLKIEEKAVKPEGWVQFDYSVSVFVDLGIDLEKQKIAVREEINKTQNYIKGIEKKLKNKEFVAKAPAEIVEKEKGRLGEARENLKKLEEQLESYG